MFLRWIYPQYCFTLVQSSYQSTTAISVTSVQSGITNYAQPGPTFCSQNVAPPPAMGYYDPSVYRIQRRGKQVSFF